MQGDQVAATVLVIVGILCMLYAAFRFFALDQSAIPLGPVGLMCAGIGVVLKRKSVS
jgi:hypothetical protein